MLKLKKITEAIGLAVYTDSGEFLGHVEEANLVENKVESWRIKINRTASLAKYLGSAKGLIIPHQFVKAIGDIFIISRAALPEKEETSEEELKI